MYHIFTVVMKRGIRYAAAQLTGFPSAHDGRIYIYFICSGQMQQAAIDEVAGVEFHPRADYMIPSEPAQFAADEET
jgi:hypothetical protein